MKLFHKIEGALAIIRVKGGILKQVDMFARGDRVFVPYSGGYLRITAEFGGEYGTAMPDVKVIEFEAEGVELKMGKEPRYVEG